MSEMSAEWYFDNSAAFSTESGADTWDAGPDTTPTPEAVRLAGDILEVERRLEAEEITTEEAHELLALLESQQE